MDIDPDRLIEALLRAGFTTAGQQQGVYVRLWWPAGEMGRGSIQVPLDRARPDYQELLDQAVVALTGYVVIGQKIWREVFFDEQVIDYPEAVRMLTAAWMADAADRAAEQRDAEEPAP